MKRNPILDAKASGRCTTGIWLTLGNTFVAEMLGRMGFDWIVIDRQHGSIEWDAVGPAIQAIELGGSCAVVRVEWNSPELIMRALDLGAVGVIVPMISTAADAEKAAQAVRYPPRGIRSFGPTRNYYSTSGEQLEPACIVMIETRLAMDNLQAIVATPGVDAVFAGPADLALDLGVPISLPMHAGVLDAMDKIVAACAATGVLPGAASFSVENATEFHRKGMRLLTLGADAGYLRRGAQADVEFASELRKDPGREAPGRK
jgi:4-hydroxy-2-oxoheptanedioate aldolase